MPRSALRVSDPFDSRASYLLHRDGHLRIPRGDRLSLRVAHHERWHIDHRQSTRDRLEVQRDQNTAAADPGGARLAVQLNGGRAGVIHDVLRKHRLLAIAGKEVAAHYIRQSEDPWIEVDLQRRRSDIRAAVEN